MTTLKELADRLNSLSENIYELRRAIWARAWANGKHGDAPPPPVRLQPVALDGKKAE